MADDHIHIDADDVMKALSLLGTSLPAHLGGAIREIAEEVMTASQELVPVDLSALKNSKVIGSIVRSGQDVSITMGYGGQAAAYAEAVHEHPSDHSPASWAGGVNWKTPGTGPKFLERPVIEAQRTFADDVGDRIKTRLGI